MSKFYSDNNWELLRAIVETNKLQRDIELFSDSNVIAEFVVAKENRDDFKLKWGPGKKGISTLVCKLCGNDSFTVGQGEYFTAIKCNSCGYQAGIHEG